MATFGAGFISDLLKSAHQTGVQDTSVKEIKNVAKELRDITDILSSKEEFFTSDIATLSENLSRLMKMRDDISKSADKDTQVLNDVVERLESTIKELQDIIHEVKAKGSFKPEPKEESKEESLGFEGVFKFLQTMPMLSMSITNSIEKSTGYIIGAINKSWADTADKLLAISSKLGILSKDIAVSTALSHNMLNDLKNYSIEAEEAKRKQDTPLMEFVKKWQSEDSPIAKMNKKMNVFGNFMKSFGANVMKFMEFAWVAIRSISVMLWRMTIMLLVSVIPWILIIAGIVLLVLLTAYIIWKLFGNKIKAIFSWLVDVLWAFVKATLETIWDGLKVVWDIVKVVWNVVSGAFDMVNAIFDGDWARMWEIIKTIGSSVWDLLLDFGKMIWNHPIIGTILSTLAGIVIYNTFMKAWAIAQAAYTTVAGLVGLLIPVLAAIPVIGWIILAIGTIVAFVWFFREEIWGFLEPIFKWIWSGLKVAWEYYTGIFGQMWDWVKGFWSTLWGGLKETVGGVLKNIGAALNPFNWFASGGEVSKPVKGVVGEAGPEAIIPLSGGGESKLSKALIEFFDYYLPWLKPTVDFLWNAFKPYMPILQSILDMIYNVVYSIISGLSNLPGWLGGNVFARLLSSMAKPSTGAATSPAAPEKDAAFARILEMNNKDVTESRLAVIGSNSNGIQSMFTAIKSQAENVTSLADMIIPSSDNSKIIKHGFSEMNKKIDQAVNNLAGTIAANANKAPILDPTYELSKMLSRGQLGGKI
jgi:phage-related protein